LLQRQPEIIKTAIDEFLRFESPNQLGNRLTTSDVDIHNVSIPAGSNLHLLIGSANRDETVFQESNTLDLQRHPNRHLAFAGGPHACLGLNLARMEGRVALGRFVERYPQFEIVSRERSQRLRFRGFERLQMSL
jgi:cytochrome P450